MLCKYLFSKEITKHEKGRNSPSCIGPIRLVHILLDINLRHLKLQRRAEFSSVPCWLPHVVSVVGKANSQEVKSQEILGDRDSLRTSLVASSSFKSLEAGTILHSFYTWRNWGSERWSNLVPVTCKWWHWDPTLGTWDSRAFMFRIKDVCTGELTHTWSWKVNISINPQFKDT